LQPVRVDSRDRSGLWPFGGQRSPTVLGAEPDGELELVVDGAGSAFALLVDAGSGDDVEVVVEVGRLATGPPGTPVPIGSCASGRRAEGELHAVTTAKIAWAHRRTIEQTLPPTEMAVESTR
jgi:hypothetical protein